MVGVNPIRKVSLQSSLSGENSISRATDLGLRVGNNAISGVALAEENCLWLVCQWVRRGEPIG